MTTSRWMLLGLFAVSASAAVVAQRMPVPDSDGRALQLFDLKQIRSEDQSRNLNADDGQHIASLLRHFVDPPLRSGDDLRAIGDRWLAVLADDQRIASVERLLQTNRARRDTLLQVQISMLQVDADAFRLQLRRFLAADEQQANAYEAVIPAADTAAFLAAGRAAGTNMSAPQVVCWPLQRTSIAAVEEIAYVKDYEVTIGNADMTADPIIDTVWEGCRNEVCATFLPGNRIGLQCSTQFQELLRPIPELSTSVVKDALPVKIQLPRTTGVRLSTVAEIDPGSLVVLASQLADGAFLIATVAAKAAEPIKRRR